MKQCPNCGRRLHLWNWKAECPGCSVNLVYFNANEILLDESEKAEIEHAKFQPKVDRGKASYFGSKLTIARLALSFFPPLASLCIPFARLNGGEYSSISLITLYKIISEKGTDAIINGITALKLPYISLALLVLSVVMLLVNTFFIFGSLGPGGKVRNIVLTAINTVIALTSAVLFAVSDIPASIEGYTGAAPGAGAFVYIALVACILVINIIIAKKGVPFEYTECLIGGLKSDEYFSLVEQGLTKEQIRRKMLVALTDLQEEARKRFEAEKEGE